jgi:hypothetical protein
MEPEVTQQGKGRQDARQACSVLAVDIPTHHHETGNGTRVQYGVREHESPTPGVPDEDWALESQRVQCPVQQARLDSKGRDPVGGPFAIAVTGTVEGYRLVIASGPVKDRQGKILELPVIAVEEDDRLARAPPHVMES